MILFFLSGFCKWFRFQSWLQMESCTFQVYDFVPLQTLGPTTWRSAGSARSFVSASLGCGTPCGKILGRCRGMWRLLAKKTNGKWGWKWCHLNLNLFVRTVTTSLGWKLWIKAESRGGLGKKQPPWMEGQKQAEAPWSLPLSTLQKNSGPLLFLWPW